MNAVDAVARALLYEGLTLYPYRTSSIKNRRRVLFGSLLPPAWIAANPEGDASTAACDVLLEGAGTVRVTLRFLRLADGGVVHEHAVEAPAIRDEGVVDQTFHIAGLEGAVRVSIEKTSSAGVLRVRAEVANTTEAPADASRDAIEAHSLAAAHLVLRAEGASWISAIDPPPALAALSASCAQRGLYPALVGGAVGARDVMLAAPIALSDHPAIAPESKGDLFDATEIEEILSLRVRTLTDGEKAEVRAAGPEAARLLDRVDALDAADFARLHGVLRKKVPAIPIGARVCLRPARRADALDVVLGGMGATVVAIEETLEGESLYCVTIDADPGRDLGERGFPGHRFFFRHDELEVRS